MLNYKKIIWIIIFFFFSIFLGIGVFWVFFQWNPGGEEIAGGINGEGGQLPATPGGFQAPVVGDDGALPASGEVPVSGLPAQDTAQPEEEPVSEVARGGRTRVLPVTSDTVKDPAVQPGGSGISYYNPIEGKFYRITPDGRKVLLSDETFYSAESITWSPDQTKAVIEYPDGSNIVYDFVRKRQATLPRQAQEFSFSPDGAEIAFEYIGGRENENWLTISRSDGTEAEFVQALGDKADAVQVAWSPSRQVVALFRKSAGLNEEEIFFLGTKQENFKSLVARGVKFQGIWSPRGDKIVYSAISPDTNYNPSLWIVDAAGEKIGKNHFPLYLQTWADKCAFTRDGATLYCGVPQDLPVGAGLDRSIAERTQDYIYRIDLRTGMNTFIAQPVNDIGTAVQVRALFVSPSEDKIFIWDSVTESLYTIRLQ